MLRKLRRAGASASEEGSHMDTAYAAVCLMCGRDVGRILQGRLIARPAGLKIQRDGRHLRCGYCRGSVILEPDPTGNPPDWVAEMERELAAAR
jgi:DNA-directed RNA polymerase subunit RPC12/RpoP